MGNNNIKIENLYIKDLETDEMNELEQIELDGINIHITGSDINKISNIEIYFKEEK